MIHGCCGVHDIFTPANGSIDLGNGPCVCPLMELDHPGNLGLFYLREQQSGFGDPGPLFLDGIGVLDFVVLRILIWFDTHGFGLLFVYFG